MKVNPTTSASSLLASTTEDEVLVAQILLDLPKMIRMLESRSIFKWGGKKRRSRLDGCASLPRVPLQSGAKIEERQPQAKAVEDEDALAVSPVTPLSFSPSESDEKSKYSLKRSSRIKSREEHIGTIQELTQNRDLLREEIENVTNYYNKLIAHNSQLKAMKKQVLNSCLRKEVATMEISRDMNLVLELSQLQPQPVAADQMAETFQKLIGPITAQFRSSSPNGPRSSVNHVGQLGIISAEEAFGVDQSQPLDRIRDFSDRRARFAEARRRRKDIIKIKSMRNASFGIKLSRTK